MPLPRLRVSVPHAPRDVLLVARDGGFVDHQHPRPRDDEAAVRQRRRAPHDPPHRVQLQLRAVPGVLGQDRRVLPRPLRVCAVQRREGQGAEEGVSGDGASQPPARRRFTFRSSAARAPTDRTRVLGSDIESGARRAAGSFQHVSIPRRRFFS